ncbi:MAG: exo-alpha-sialidase [Candidatus Hydrogenedentes bacterium]|nr:exo-alpha-sialidase [Candidatus Hydrogenedentota bacterium]
MKQVYKRTIVSRFEAAAILMCVLCTAAYAGVSFSNPSPLNSNAGSDSTNDLTPRIATDRGDTFVVVWASQDTLGGTVGSDYDIFVSRSTNDGAAWSNVTTLNDDATTDSTSDEAPDIATDGSTWIAVWASRRSAGSGDGTDPDIFFSRSTNGGAAWSPAAAIHSNATADLADADENPRIFTDGNGVWICAWASRAQLDAGSQFDEDIVAVRSDDDGDTWGAPFYLNGNFSDASADDINPFLAVSEEGAWIAVWESNDTLEKGAGVDWDILFARSTDGGENWGDAQFLNSDAPTDQGNSPIGSDAGARVYGMGSNTWFVTWHRYLGGGGTQLRFARSTTNGASWSAPKVFDNPASDSKESDDSSQELDMLTRWFKFFGKGAQAPEPLLFGVAIGDKNVANPGNSDQVTGNDYDLRSYFLSTEGKVWTAPEIANPNAYTDSGDDINPVIAADEEGHVVVVWSSYDDLDDTIGTDADILVSTATVAGVTELVAPNGGEKWKRGKKRKIEWVTNLDADDDVRLDLYRDGNKVQTIKNATPNDGAFKWKVPNNIQEGGKYQVEIKLKSDGNVNDRSLYDFNVK